jgi:hypothetical protein
MLITKKVNNIKFYRTTFEHKEFVEWIIDHPFIISIKAFQFESDVEEIISFKLSEVPKYKIQKFYIIHH